MKLSFVPHTLKFKRPFSIAHGSRDSTPVVFTCLEESGMFGYGEASLPPYLAEDHNTVLDFLRKAESVLAERSVAEGIETILRYVDAIAAGNKAAKAAIDIALHDLDGKTKNTPCHRLFGANVSKPIYTAYTIPMDEPVGIKSRVSESAAYRLLKVKLGAGDDKKFIEEIRKHASVPLIADANEGWTDRSHALDMIHWLSERNVQMVEQPMPKKQHDDIAWLTERSPLPVIADEGVQRLADVEKAKGIYSGINIKLMKCTGLNEARKMIALARKHSMMVMIGCMSETSCGVSAAAQLAPFADWVDLDGPLLIKEDYFSGVKFSDGKIVLNDLPGIGVAPAFKWL